MKKFKGFRSEANEVNEANEAQSVSEELNDLLDTANDEFVEVETTNETEKAGEAQNNFTLVEKEVEEEKVTIIGKGTVIQGDLKIKGDLEMYGEVIGNIDCEAHVSLSGVVRGNILCQSANFDGGIVTGNIQTTDKVFFGEKTEVFGEVKANIAEVLGKIKGDCQVTSDLLVKGSGAVIGDINAGNIMIEKGAVIQGNIKIIKDVFFEFDA